MKELYSLRHYFLKHKLRLGLGVVFVFLTNFFRLWQPKIFRQGLDFVIDNLEKIQSGEMASETIRFSLLKFGGLIILASVVAGIFLYAMRQTVIKLSRMIEYELRRDILAHYFKLDLGFFKRNTTGDLMSRVSEDVSKVRMFLGPVILYGINVTFLFILVIISMVKVSPTLTMYSLFPLPILSISIYYVSNIINMKSKRIQELLASLTSIAQEVYSGIRVVKSFGREQQMQAFFDDEGARFEKKSMELARIDSLFRPMMLLLIGISTVITVFKGGQLVIAGAISAGHVAEFIIYVNMLTWPVTAIGWIASITQQAEASQKRINEYLNQSPAIKNPTGAKYDFQGHIEFQNVSFTYPDTGIEALKNISFEIRPGEKVAIVGKTGSGKTSIAELLLRMYDVTSGRILVDGRDIREHNIDYLRKLIGYVPQDNFLFSDTVANNISFGKVDIDRAGIIQAAKDIAIYDDIMQFSDGFDTRVGERGVTLSGGQKQRIAIARAFVKGPQMLILDDSLSAVDTRTEKKILDYLRVALAQKTTIIITHRMSSVLDFDKILVIHHSELEEVGTHEELIKKNEYYRELVK